MENIPRNHNVGPPREDSKSNERITDGKRKETKKDVNIIHRQLRIMLANSLAVIGLSCGLDQKKNGTEPTLTNPTDHGIKLPRK